MHLRLTLACVAALLPSCVMAATCSDITARVCPLSPSYDPSPPKSHQNYQAPACSSGSIGSSPAAVQRAFAIAPEGLKNELCKLKNVFVTNSESGSPKWGSWGMWENIASGRFPYSGDGGKSPASFIGLHTNLFSMGLAAEEDALLKGAAPNAAAFARYTLTGPGSGGTTAQDLAMLAVLAHEAAHIKWHRDHVIQQACVVQGTIVPSWDSTTISEANHSPWNDVTNAKGAAHRAGHGIPPPGGSITMDQLKKMYGAGITDDGYATAAGAVTPEEDFVEAYKIAALRKAAGSGSPISFKLVLALNDGTQIDVNGQRNPVVENKIACAAQIGGF